MDILILGDRAGYVFDPLNKHLRTFEASLAPFEFRRSTEKRYIETAFEIADKEGSRLLSRYLCYVNQRDKDRCLEVFATPGHQGYFLHFLDGETKCWLKPRSADES